MGARSSFSQITQTLKYLVKKTILEGRIFRWLLLFQEFTFEVISKLGRLNVRLDHLSILESGEIGSSLDNQLPDVDLFRVEAILDYLEEISTFLAIGKCPKEYTMMQRRYMVMRAPDY